MREFEMETLALISEQQELKEIYERRLINQNLSVKSQRRYKLCLSLAVKRLEAAKFVYEVWRAKRASDERG